MKKFRNACAVLLALAPLFLAACTNAFDDDSSGYTALTEWNAITKGTDAIPDDANMNYTGN